MQKEALVHFACVLLALQFLVNLSRFQNRPALVDFGLCLQFFMPIFIRASSIDSNHLSLSAPTCQVPSGLNGVSFLHSKEVSQPPQSSYLVRFDYELYVVNCKGYKVHCHIFLSQYHYR
jgi:hypothetical protein